MRGSRMIKIFHSCEQAQKFSNEKQKTICRMSGLLYLRVFPVPGHVKTRLMAELGPDGAAELHRRMTEFTVTQIRQTGIKMEIRFTGGSESQMREWLGSDGKYTLQGTGDLGARMERAVEDAFNQGEKKVLVVGSDCPDNRAANILKAVKFLNDGPCVLGPATDGGYYLIGLCEPRPDLFCDVDWGTERVFKQNSGKTGPVHCSSRAERC